MKSSLVLAAAQLFSLSTCEQIPIQHVWEPSAMMDNSTVDDKLYGAAFPGLDASMTRTGDTQETAQSTSSATPGYYRVPLVNLGNNEYYATMSIGTPPQPINIGLDTGSGNLWVRSVTCKCEGCAHNHHNRHHHHHHHQSYDSSASSSYRPDGSPFEITYGVDNARVLGHFSRDTVHIGGVSVPDVLFAEATELTGPLYSFMRSDGTLGLGFQAHAVGEVLTVFESMLQKDLLRDPVFAFYFGDVRHESDGGGEFTIGGVNRDRYSGELITLSPWRPYEWDIEFNAVTVGDETMRLVGTGASIDSGCSGIMVPVRLAEFIHTKIGATKLPNDDYVVPCDKRADLPDITFTFGGHPFDIGPDAYLFEEEEEDDDQRNCRSAFYGQDYDIPGGGQFAVVGTAFLREWYSVFDVREGTVSFGRAKRA